MINATLNTDAKLIHISASSAVQMTDVYIDTQKTFNCENEPSINASHIEVTGTLGEDGLYHIDMDVDLTSFSLGNTILMSNINTDLFFVFVLSGVSYMTDVTYDNRHLMDFVYNTLYKSIDTGNCCEDISNVPVDILLLYYAFINASSYRDKVFFWDKIYLNGNGTNNKCKCNGK